MSQSILLHGLTSPVRTAMRSSRPRSILRRSTAMPMSPTPFPYANFSVLVSPSLQSPHVQFMASPQLVATFTTHSSETYDRAPIKVSPNLLDLPARGDRYFSPSLANFKLADPPKPKAAVQKRLDSILRSSQQCASPAITEFEDPRSPKEAVASTQQVRFSSFASPRARAPQDLSHSLASYPRSPYPSASEFSQRKAETPAEVLNRSRSLSESTAPRKNKASSRPAPFTPLASPLQQSFKPPVTAGLQRSHRPAPLALEPQDDPAALSDAFWDAVTLEGEETPMVTALEYPASATDTMEDVDLKSPGPALIFGNQNGEVWSPAPAVKQTPARESLLRSALMSPGKAAFGRMTTRRSQIASPSPNDPFAAFPSFAAALSMAPSDPAITYPAPAMVIKS